LVDGGERDALAINRGAVPPIMRLRTSPRDGGKVHISVRNSPNIFL
jgi:hypothetical protein